jgi:DNA-binding response OmpR family regulator
MFVCSRDHKGAPAKNLRSRSVFVVLGCGLSEHGYGSVALGQSGDFVGRCATLCDRPLVFSRRSEVVHRAETTRILLVEDEPIAAKALARLFASCGFSTLVAASLGDARSLVATWAENACAYAFVDNTLGDGFGIELLPELRVLDPMPAVALISNWLTSDLAGRAFREGAVPMAKPEDERTMRDLIALLDARRERAPSERRGEAHVPGTGGPWVTFGAFALGQRDLVTPSGRLRLRRAERAILAFLVAQEGSAASAQEIANEALKRADHGAARSVYSHVTNLRAALGGYAALVETVPGASGYRLALEIFER